MTIHPDVSGRPQVILMLERMIEYITGHDGVRWATLDEIADDFKARYPRRADDTGGQGQRHQPRSCGDRLASRLGPPSRYFGRAAIEPASARVPPVSPNSSTHWTGVLRSRSRSVMTTSTSRMSNRVTAVVPAPSA